MKYENILNSPKRELKVISRFFNFPIDDNWITNAVKILKKNNTNKVKDIKIYEELSQKARPLFAKYGYMKNFYK